MPLPEKTEDEMRELALQIARGEIFTSLHIHEKDWPEMVGMVFMPLGLGGLPEGVQSEEVGMVYAPMAKAGPRSINGYPCFFEMTILNREQTRDVLERARKIDEAMKAAAGGGA